ncbi:DNA polymerase III subunit beta [Cutibacterium avidum]|uniref:Uncharacterized protein n=1 Tax=Cutibacterium avidum TaxID=33010 RepID=A0A3E2DPS6_9ACTN|nr:hypothetical protein CHT91_01120 [Cutibacterium avidum]TMT55882.1 DNA polymerase III subunit beta [Cutibacterium avidum]
MGQRRSSTGTPSTHTSGPRRHPHHQKLCDYGFQALSTRSTAVMTMKKGHTSPSLKNLWVWIWGQGLLHRCSPDEIY